MGIIITKKITNIKTKTIDKPVAKPKYNDNNSGEEWDTLEELVSFIYEDDYVDVSFITGSVAFNLNSLPYCCGIFEIGDLSVTKETKTEELTKFLDLYVNNHNGTTLMINTNGRNSSIDYEKALAKCKNWILVKQFKSSNSKNTISMWISRNE
jgi:hypothetical protein